MANAFCIRELSSRFSSFLAVQSKEKFVKADAFTSTQNACAPRKIKVAYLNENYLKLQAGYLFPEVARRVREFCEGNPEAAKRLIRCGIGDVTEPLPRAAIEAMKQAVEELGDHETFRGYGP